MERNIDPNRPYRRIEIDKEFEKVKSELHSKAVKKGESKFGEKRAYYKDGYTGKELKGGDNYEYDHARSAEEIFNKYKATHTNEEIAKIVNHPSNIVVTHFDVNRYKGKYRFEDKLSNAEKVKEHGINKKLTLKRLYLADALMKLRALRISGGFFNILKAFGVGLYSMFIRISLPIILAIVLLLLIFSYSIFIDTDDKTNTKPEITIEQNILQKNIVIKDSGNDKPVLSFSNSLSKITESIIYEDKYSESITKNVIPVIGVMFNKNSAKLSKEGKVLLKEFVSDYSKLVSDTYINVNGYTCNLGNKSYNLKLSIKRAENVKRYLIDLGIKQSKIKTHGYGESKFTDERDEQYSLTVNRRCNILIFE